MTRIHFGTTAAILGLAGACLLPATTVLASSENAASVARNGECWGFVPTSNGGVGDMIHTTEGHHRVVTRSGSSVVSCEFDIPNRLKPSGVTKATGFGCGVDGQPTNHSSMLATPGGRALLICEIKR